eukprot:892393-Amphidinium_carterae.1
MQRDVSVPCMQSKKSSAPGNTGCCAELGTQNWKKVKVALKQAGLHRNRHPTKNAQNARFTERNRKNEDEVVNKGHKKVNFYHKL